MKNFKNLMMMIFIASSIVGNSQITFENAYTKQIWLDKFHLSGYKYVEVQAAASIINIYNINHTLYHTIPIPPFSGSYSSIGFGFVSEQLFDLDTAMEFVVTYLVTIPNHNQVFIYNEDGSLLFFRDSGSVYHSSADTYAYFIGAAVFFDGTSTKMKVQQGAGLAVKYEVYSLPGSIPCIECSTGIISGLAPIDTDQKGQSPIVYPNPTTGELKLNYKLPQGCTKAQILIFDSTGKQVKEYTITDTFTNILLPEEFNNGMYLYSLKVNNEIIKTEKIILSK